MWTFCDSTAEQRTLLCVYKLTILSSVQVVPDEAKDQKYWTRRERNNYAAKRSREARRLKENQIVLRANFLEKENVALRESIEEITRENERLKERLSSCTCR
ncbi:Transcription factor VBP [Amphibalanus amphitrite]|uniref:Transcription factor VBP n=1 Tax=Amphibalanus amphitrite TaxID=1232801 RepID=A0A6A4V9B9_AMPAM|nr:Transcription factor VBP [Amphibalanus amphitrite]